MPSNKFTLGAGMGRVGGSTRNARELLMSFGVGSYLAPMAQQVVFMLPRTTDPDAQGTILVVEAAQRGLQMMGAPVRASGILDAETVRGIIRVSGPNWNSKTWIQILGDLSDMIRAGKQLPGSSNGLSEYLSVDGFDVKPLAIGAGIALVAWHLFFRKGRRR